MAQETALTTSQGSRESAPLITCSVGIMAYNEEKNIGGLLKALIQQETGTYCGIQEIIVLASGCTDKTEAIARDWAVRDPRIKVVVQPRREGKASAVNLFLRHAQSDILVMESADTMPEPTTVARLLEPFLDPEVGMTGGHPIPVNDSSSFMGFTVHLLWDLHHHIASEQPKLGELTAFRRVFERIPRDSAVDEANMEPLIRGQGYQLRYVPNAIVHNRGPETVSDFLKQRRRIYAGHLRMQREQGYVVATMNGSRILMTLLRSWRWGLRGVFWVPGVMALEAYGRFLGWRDYHFKRRDHAIWEIAATTKRSI